MQVPKPLVIKLWDQITQNAWPKMPNQMTWDNWPAQLHSSVKAAVAKWLRGVTDSHSNVTDPDTLQQANLNQVLSPPHYMNEQQSLWQSIRTTSGFLQLTWLYWLFVSDSASSLMVNQQCSRSPPELRRSFSTSFSPAVTPSLLLTGSVSSLLTASASFLPTASASSLLTVLAILSVTTNWRSFLHC